MRIFRLAFNPIYRSLRLADLSLLNTPAFRFDSTSRLDNWMPADLLLADDVNEQEPDIWQVHGLPTAFACSAKVANDLSILWECCEKLPVFYNGHPFMLYNLTERGCYDALDVALCKWVSGIPKVGVPSVYTFHTNNNGLPRVGSPTLFSVPETCTLEVYVYEYEGDPDEEFKAGVESRGLTGLAFEQIWGDHSVCRQLSIYP